MATQAEDPWMARYARNTGQQDSYCTVPTHLGSQTSGELDAHNDNLFHVGQPASCGTPLSQQLACVLFRGFG